MTAISERQKLAYANAQAADGRVNLEFETDEGMTLNMGPQHPATHGTLRIVLKLDGEQVISCEPIMGYMTGATRSSPRCARTRRSPRW